MLHPKKILLSVIIPICNEERNIKPLYSRLKESLTPLHQDFEIIFINDGSTDKSEKILKDIYKKDRRVIIISHQTRLGKAAALGSGFESAQGKLIITMDGDLQDDPKEIPKFVKKILQGYDLVSGWRLKRKDAFFKIFTSRVMNLLISLLSGFKFHDFYCGLKCCRQETLRKLNLYGGLYRFTMVFAQQEGLRITELPIKHHHRKFGNSKYGGLRRFQRALSDLAIILLAVKGKGFVAKKFVEREITREQRRKKSVKKVSWS